MAQNQKMVDITPPIKKIDLRDLFYTVGEVLLSHHCFLIRWKMLRDYTVDSGFTLDLVSLQDVLPIVVNATAIALERPMKFDYEQDVHLILTSFLCQFN